MTDEGYSVYDSVFERSAMRRVLDALANTDLVRTRAGARHVLTVPAIRDLADDPRLMQIAAWFVGPTVAVPGNALRQIPESNWLVVWHQDTALPLCRRVDDPDWGPWSTKAGRLYAHAPAWALETVVALRVHLDDSAVTNGPLRVLPGTHRLGVLDDEQIDHLARDVAAVDCLADSGGVVAMRPLTVHASSKSRDDQPRRVLHIEYAAAVELRSGIELALG